MTNYIYYQYDSSHVAKVKEDTIEYEKATTIHNYLNKECLKYGSSLQGRKESYTFLMHQKKYIPILIRLEPLELYFPTGPKKDPNCTWINYAAIESIQYKKKTCTIHFHDHTCLTCSNPNRIKENMHAIYRYLYKLKAYSQPPLHPLQP